MANTRRAMLDSIRHDLINMSRNGKAALSMLVDLAGTICASVLALWVLAETGLTNLTGWLVALAPASIAVLFAWRLGLYRSVVRYVGLDLLAASSTISVVCSGFGATILLLAGHNSLAMRWALVFCALTVIFLTAVRYFASVFLATRQRLGIQEKVAIYGAGSLGAQLVSSLRSSLEFAPVALLDNDEKLSGKRIKGLEVYPPSDLQYVIEKLGVSRVLLALPKTSRRSRRRILEQLSEHPVHVQTVPELDAIVSGKAKLDDIADVDVKDLLGRDSVPPNEKLLRASITGKSVMVTGAGGSIGSELCRQILKLNPRCLVMFELCEPSLYAIEMEIRKLRDRAELDIEIVALLGSVHHEDRLREAMQAFKINTVFHAAAYKHVPMVEHNVFEGIHNNVFGTLHSARAARNAGVESFILISTDKAVNPTNVMGATKRMAELILQSMNSESATRFSMVRFGNVLESSGSVVPLFRQQIRNGGPVTVTHRDIIRYFMTIPEAAQLVIQAGAMAKGGDVFVLDMGKPVKIYDLAVRMINLMGMTVKGPELPEGDIEIAFVGLRPAEKLYEELLIGSNVTGTEHPRILRADEECISKDKLNSLIDEMKSTSAGRDYERAKEILIEAVKEYTPSEGIDDHVWKRKQSVKREARDDRVIEFPSAG